MTDPVLVLRKVSLMREHVGRVRRRRPRSAEALRADVDLQDAIAMSLFVAIQDAVDVAMHIAADEGWGVPSSYADAFDILARHGVLADEHARALGKTVAVRNRIAHGYASLDVEKLWTEIPAGLDALERYAIAVARFVGPK